MSTKQTGNGRGTLASGSPEQMDAIPAARLVQLAQATPEQQAQVDAILAGRGPVAGKPDIGTAEGNQYGTEPYIRKPEMALRLGVKPRSLDAMMADGRVVFYKIGKSVRFRWSEVQAHLALTAKVSRRTR